MIVKLGMLIVFFLSLIHISCAAFDRFKNFMERGRAFKELVRSL